MDTVALVKGCLKGRAEAQRQLYEHYLPYVLTVIRRFGVESAEQPDLVQDIFVAVFQGLGKFDPQKGDLHHWLRGLAVHKTIAHQRIAQRLKTETLAPGLEASASTTIDLSHFDTEYLLELIGQLPVGARTVFNLYAIDGYSHQEIANMLNISEVGARSQLSRAKKLLRDALAAKKNYKHTWGH